jgi:hypothetical protein
MSSRHSRTLSTLANTIQRLVRRSPQRLAARKRQARLRLLEHLEPRNLMAVNIVGLSPADGDINWPVNTDLTINFNVPVVKGQGAIHVVRQDTGALGVAVDVNSPDVSISGSTVTVDLPADLLANTAYFVSIDSGAFLDNTVSPTSSATLLTQNFEFLPLDPFVSEGGGDGTDYTLTPPLNFSVDNSTLPAGGVAEWAGWSFADKGSWTRAAGDQARSAFTLGAGKVAVADSDEYDDSPSGAAFDSKFLTRPIKLDGVTPNSVVLEFDSSFRPEDSQIGTLDVRFDGGPWVNLLTLNPTNTSNTAPSGTFVNASINERLVSGTTTGVSTDLFGGATFAAVNNPAGASTMEFRWGVTGDNDWWWAIDNLLVKGEVAGTPFTGVNDATTWNLDVATLTVSVDPLSISENGGTATGTVSRNGAPVGALVVNLASSDTSEVTVPATVTIPAGASSVTFPITAVDDLLSDRLQTAVITASAATFVDGSASINVLDDEGPKIISLTPADNATGVNYQTNLTITFDTNVQKGNGVINLVRASDNRLVSALAVQSPAVSISGATVTINPPINLDGLTEYYVLIDDGTFLDTSATATANAVLLTQSFDLVPLAPFTSEPAGDGTDFSKTPPVNFSIDNSGMPGGSASDFYGWSFMDKNSWIATSGNGGRADFVSGQNTIAVADPVQWNETAGSSSAFNSFLRTSPINLSGVAAGSIALEFDYSFRSATPGFAVVDVSYDGGTTWNALLQFDGSVPGSVPDGKISIDSTGLITGPSGALVGTLSNPSSGSLQFRFGELGTLGGWFAVDNVKIQGGVNGVPFQGISSPATWSFTTAEAPTLTVNISPASMSENGGSATGTVTRNLDTTNSLVVTLSSSDTSEATVPATVTIPAGQASVTFPITAVDDLLSDGTQTVTISASVTDFFSNPATIDVLDDDFPKVTILSPADNAVAVSASANLVITFDQNVKKGNGFVHIVRAIDGKIGQSIDIQSAAVTIAGATVTINPPTDLDGLTDYFVRFEPGAILNNTSSPKEDAILLSQDFELLPLLPAVFETVGIDGTDFTTIPPAGYQVDNSLMPPGGVPEWTGWTFADKNFWATQGGQARGNFTRGTGTIAVGDTDEWDDTSTLNNNFNSFFRTAPVNLSGVAPNSVVLEFDSSFRPENSQIGTLEVSFNGGTDWSNILTLDPTNTSNPATSSNINERRSLPISNPSSGSMVFRWGVTGANDWWWALDNIVVTGDVAGLPYPGIVDTTTWNFTTAEVQSLGLTVDVATIVENGGSATGTVSRNLGTTGALVVSLASSKPGVVTVPATVTIPDGQASVTFPITAVDNSVANGARLVTVSANAAGFVNASSTLTINDNEVANVVISEIMYNPAGAEPRTEWIELYNRGSTVVDLSNWYLDDEDTSNWGAFAAGTQLQPGQVGVVYNSFFGSNTESLVRSEWSIPASAAAIGVFWGSLANDPNIATGNEVLGLRDEANNFQDLVSFDDTVPVATGWPVNTNGVSIYLTDLSADNNVGTNWAQSVVGVAGAVNALGPTFNVADIGSPGTVPAPLNSTVTNRQIFYNRSTSTIFGDGTGNPVNAIDPNKVALLPGQTATFANYTNYARGINGLVVDLQGLSGTPTSSDFLFATWDGIDASGFQPLAATATVTVLPGGGVGGASRVKIEFADNAVRNTWLRVSMLANANTGLAANDVFYFGNAVGDFNAGNLAGPPVIVRTNATDTSAVRQNQSTGINSAAITNIYDINKDGRVNATDTSTVRQNQDSSIIALITAPASLSLAFAADEGWVGLPAVEDSNTVSQGEASTSRSSTIIQPASMTNLESPSTLPGTSGNGSLTTQGPSSMTSTSSSGRSSLAETVDAFFASKDGSLGNWWDSL